MCVNVVHLSSLPKCSFSQRLVRWRAVCDVVRTTYINQNKCNFIHRCTKHKRSIGVPDFVSAFSSVTFMTTIVSILVSLFFSFVLFFYSCKRFANQNAMYSRYGLYFRLTALQTVCKYYQLNEGKQRRRCTFSPASFSSSWDFNTSGNLSCCPFCCESDGATSRRSV